MVGKDSRQALLAGASAWWSATACLQDRLREVLELTPLPMHPDAARLDWVRLMPSAGNGDGRSWKAEPCHPFFGDGIAVHTVEDHGEAGERGAGGPYFGLAHLMLTDIPDDQDRDVLARALTDVRSARQAYDEAIREALTDLRIVGSGGSETDLLGWVADIPAGEARGERSWRAEPRWRPEEVAGASVFCERHADDPRLSELVGLVLVEVP